MKGSPDRRCGGFEGGHGPTSAKNRCPTLVAPRVTAQHRQAIEAADPDWGAHQRAFIGDYRCSCLRQNGRSVGAYSAIAPRMAARGCLLHFGMPMPIRWL